MFRRLVFVCGVALFAACASAGSTASKMSAPQLSDPSSHPIYDITTMGDIRQIAGRRIDYEIWVGADGVPDATSVRVTGAPNSRLADAYRSWLTTSKFKPAMSNGQPVGALYKAY